MFFDNVQAENQRTSNASFIQTRNKLIFEKINDVVKELKKKLMLKLSDYSTSAMN